MKKSSLLSIFTGITLIAVLFTAACVSLPRLSGSITISVQGGGDARPGKTLEANYTGDEVVTYQWKRGSTNLGTEPTQLASEPGNYTVTVSAEEFRSKTSSAIGVDYPNLSGTISVSVQGGGAVTTGKTLVANYTGSEAVSYQWKRDSTNLGTSSSQVASEPGSYTVTVSAQEYKNKTSSAVTVDYPDLSGALSVRVQGGGTVTTGKTLVANYTGSELVSYQWKRGSTNLGTSSNQVASEPGSYTVTVTARGFKSKTSAAVSVAAPVSTNIYVITGSGTSFSADKDGEAVASGAIQAVIEGIRAAANGAAVSIQFGDGTTPLNIGATKADFNNTGGTWGAVTITGKITGAPNSGSPFSVVILGNGVSGIVNADISDTRNSLTNALQIIGGGTVTISGGTITGDTGVYITSGDGAPTVNITGGTIDARLGVDITSGTVNVSGGTITSSRNAAIMVTNSSNTANISGGTIQGTGAQASAITSFGRVNLTGNPVITSADTRAEGGTIRLMGGHSTGLPTLTIASSVTPRNTAGGSVVFINPRANPAPKLEGWPR